MQKGGTWRYQNNLIDFRAHTRGRETTEGEQCVDSGRIKHFTASRVSMTVVALESFHWGPIMRVHKGGLGR